MPLDNGRNINPERRAHDFFLLYVLVYQHYAFFIVHISIFKHNYIWCIVARIVMATIQLIVHVKSEYRKEYKAITLPI